MSEYTPARGQRDPMDPYDAVLVASFGGPRSREEVMPFLRRVSNGRVPDSRLADVAEHYYRFDGVSPINEANEALLEALRQELRSRGSDIPVELGNRNSAPWFNEVVSSLYDQGARRILMLPTAAFDSYSGCRQYREDADKAVAALGHPDLVIDKIAPFHGIEGYAVANAQAVMASFSQIPPTPLEATRVAFVTHSIPLPMVEASGSGEPGTDYVSQHLAACTRIAELVRQHFGAMPQWDLVYCSRSGRPTDPWLEPDVNDYLETLPGQGVSSVVLAPIGFVSDHMEVVNDLDHEAAETAQKLGLAVARAATPDSHPALVAGLVALLTDQADAVREADGAVPKDLLCPCEQDGSARGGRSLSPDTHPGAGHPAGPAHPIAGSAGTPASPVTGHGATAASSSSPQPPAEAAEPVVPAAPIVPASQPTPAPAEPAAPAIPVSQPTPAPHQTGDFAVAQQDTEDQTRTAPIAGSHRPDGTYTVPTDARDQPVDPDQVNKASLWGMYSVFKVTTGLPADPGARAELVDGSVEWVTRAGAETRGWYDLSGLRADADLLVWWTSDDAAVLQDSYHRFVGTGLGRHLTPVWSNLAVHRPAEFNKSHLPSCFAGVAPRRWACFYPFVRTKDWYLLDAKDRSAMLREHGMAGAASPDVKASTLAAFALGDYEWILTLEGDDLARLVDVMKDMRYVEARRHVDIDTPFYTGERVDPDTWAGRQLTD
ncbi:ferrochelatase [Acidipropionibacterium jensenii]|uniref:Coproporphyrin III ferrochelatase n=1 Tax=Acidipropionibacterium jensenii TaxID=1749 RepID=A0A3T0RX56_9ACTN|nr:hydrogen peroxide-dependent heme synthase [Acidipropionibacterium jensenii]AZZ38737.1 ferrochelatase [Acidipropionibacterium jensenii]